MRLKDGLPKSVVLVTATVSVCLLIAYLVNSTYSCTPQPPNRGLRAFRLGQNLTTGALGASALGGKRDKRYNIKNAGSKATQAEIAELLSNVAKDLAPWKESGISLEMVEKAYCTEEIHESMRIQVVNGSLYLVGPTDNYQHRARTSQRQLMDLHDKYQIPDVDFILTTSDRCKTNDAPHRSHDGNMERCTRNAPLFSGDKQPWESHCVTCPDFSFGGWPEAFLPHWGSARTWILAAAELYPFKDRKKEIFWRGGDTNDQRKIMAESQLVQTSGVVDVKLMRWGRDEGFEQDFVSLGDHCSYKHLLHLSGIAYSARLRYIMLCASAIVFPGRFEEIHREFWFHMLKPGHNIVFTEYVNYDNWGGHVVDTVRDLQANATKAEEIGRNGQYLVSEILHQDNVDRYYMELLTQYSKLQTFKPQVHADAVPLATALLRPARTKEVRDRTCKVC